MSISHKKIRSLISDHIENTDGLSVERKENLERLCEKIYLIESDLSNASAQQKISEIRQEVMKFADRLKDLK